jgi:hypothetical protein
LRTGGVATLELLAFYDQNAADSGLRKLDGDFGGLLVVARSRCCHVAAV